MIFHLPIGRARLEMQSPQCTTAAANVVTATATATATATINADCNCRLVRLSTAVYCTVPSL